MTIIIILASAFKALRPFSLARPQSATFVGIAK